jgi:hypothetical protein
VDAGDGALQRAAGQRQAEPDVDEEPANSASRGLDGAQLACRRSIGEDGPADVAKLGSTLCRQRPGERGVWGHDDSSHRKQEDSQGYL